MSRHLVMLGFGAVGRVVLGLLRQHGVLDPARLLVLDRDESAVAAARARGVEARQALVTRDTLPQVLGTHANPDDLLLNLAPAVSTTACVEYCYSRAILYLDAALQLWPGDSRAGGLAPAARTAFAARDALLAFGRRHPGGPTALFAHGANPGLTSHLLRHALTELARGGDAESQALASQAQWGLLARRCGVRTVQLVTRDDQTAPGPRPAGALRNSWSPHALMDAALQPAELAWGSHEQHWPADGVDFGFGAGAAIHLTRVAGETMVRGFTPRGGPCHAWMLPSPATSAIGEALAVREGGRTTYRPTCLRAIRPRDEARLALAELRERGFASMPGAPDDPAALDGGAETGVLLGGMRGGALWCGWTLDAAEARRLCPDANAITMPVAAALLAAMAWMEREPNAGVVEPLALPGAATLDACRPFLGSFVCAPAAWTPSAESADLFPSGPVPADPWQFPNLRVGG